MASSSTTGGRVAVVTGASRGIGRGIALALAARGWRLVVNYRANAAEADRVRDAALTAGAPAAIALPADVAHLDQGAALVDRVAAEFGRIDLWVNNAGIAPQRRADLLDVAPDSWDRVLGTNLRGPFFLTQRVARLLIDQPRDPDGPPPAIVFVTSISSTLATRTRGEYCVSKAAASMVVRLFADRLADHGIPVFEIRPGIIDTDMTAAVHAMYDQRIADGLSPIRRWGTPDDVGRAVVALADGALPFCTGEVIHVDGGLHLPRL